LNTHGASFERRVAQVSNVRKLRIITSSALLAFVSLQACAGLTDRPELYPYKWAPQQADREWVAQLATMRGYTDIITTREADPFPSEAVQNAREYDLPTLVELALTNNPGAERAWSAARYAAASFGAAQASYYPQVGFSSDNGYERTIVQLPGVVGALNQWQSDPLVEMNWTVLDFGRRRKWQ
jgi:outer membrane protein TolC